MTIQRIVLWLIFVLFLVTNVLSQNNWNGEIKIINRIPHILNQERPIYTKPTVILKKEWELGGEDPGFIFNNITAIDVDNDGRIYITDVLEKNVKVFSILGTHLFTFGRHGQGPGEFQIPRCINILPDNKILSIDIGGTLFPRFKFFDFKGNYIDEFEVELQDSNISKNVDRNSMVYLSTLKMITYSKLLNENNLILFTRSTEKMKYDVHSLWKLDYKHKNDLKILSVKKENPRYSNVVNHNDRDYLNTQWCLDNMKNIYLTDDIYEYNIKQYDIKGHIKKVIKREFALPSKTKEEFEEDLGKNKEFEKYMQKKGKILKWKTLKKRSIIFNRYACTRGMFCDEKNRLWVLTNESFLHNGTNIEYNEFENSNKKNPDQQSTRFTFDVFNSKGKFLMKIPFDGEQPRCFVQKNSYLYFADLKEDGYPWLFKYKIIE
jgi:hypothetical protein